MLFFSIYTFFDNEQRGHALATWHNIMLINYHDFWQEGFPETINFVVGLFRLATVSRWRLFTADNYSFNNKRESVTRSWSPDATVLEHCCRSHVMSRNRF